MEAVTNGGGAGFDAGDLEFNHSVAEEGDDALERADPAEAFGRSRGDAPAHRLGPGESADDRWDRFGEDVGGPTAGLVDHGEEDAVARSAARRVGEEGCGQCRNRWS